MKGSLFGGTAGTVGRTFESAAQSTMGNLLDGQLMSLVNQGYGLFQMLAQQSQQYINIKDVTLQTNTYGKIIPQVFGRTRVAGNIIWSTDIIKKTVDYGAFLGKNIFGSAKITVRASFAIALSEGVIDSVDAIYANDRMLNLRDINVVIYRGTQDQMPNSTMQSYLGVKNTPAFRGLAYVVFSDFPLENYDGVMPNFTFDVIRNNVFNTNLNVQQMVSGVTMIPGSGEAVYDNKVQYGYVAKYVNNQQIRISKSVALNKNTNFGKTDFEVSLDSLKVSLPNVKWVSLVVNWFCNTLDAKNAVIYPATEDTSKIIEPDEWIVAGYNKSNVRQVTRDKDGRANYGGTISDASLLRGVAEMKNRGLNVCFYPMVFVDNAQKPWRGWINASTAQDVVSFFNQKNGYNEFILQYARLLKGKVDAFIIGSEFVGLTKFKTSDNIFTAVVELIKLADAVKDILGNDVVVTYAADWSEYHHTDGGWFNLDELWACKSIDVIGIDAYFPLSNSASTIYDSDIIKSGWQSGEGYDFYYQDSQKTQSFPLSPAYAWKNIRYFWENIHYNPNGKTTLWQPKMKKIWFTEYGFPSVDCCTNQPNVFYSPGSINSSFPIFSKGLMDFKAQKAAIFGSELFFAANNDMITNKFLWTWDARPYPFFPSMMDVWSDGASWQYGHFINGKIGGGRLGDIILHLCLQCGIAQNRINTDALDDDINGYVIDAKQPAAVHIANLSQIFLFDAFMQDGVLTFLPLRKTIVRTVDFNDVIIAKEHTLFQLQQECGSGVLVGKIELMYRNISNNYKIASAYAVNSEYDNGIVDTIKTNVPLYPQEAQDIARKMIFMKSINKDNCILSLPQGYTVQPLDLLRIIKDDIEIATVRVRIVKAMQDGTVTIEGTSDDAEIYNFKNYNSQANLPTIETVEVAGQAVLVAVDTYNFIPHSTGLLPTLFLCCYDKLDSWRGATIYVSTDKGRNYNVASSAILESIFGFVTVQSEATLYDNIIDFTSVITVAVIGGNADVMYSVNDDDWFNCVNLAMINSEIVAFRDVRFINNNTVEIKGLIRGLYGTKMQPSVEANSSFMLIDKNRLVTLAMSNADIGRQILIRAVANGLKFEECSDISIVFNGLNVQSFPAYNVSSKVLSNGDIVISWLATPNVEYDFFSNGYTAADFAYRVNILNASDIVRSEIARNVELFTYTTAMQLQDFNAVQEAVNFTVVPY